jgi:sec-independent protein translocase protein TatB
MFDVAPTELLLVALVALVVIGPKDLPRAMRFVGNWVGKARGMARHFRSGLDEMVRQAELDEMEKKWAAENERIMREHPAIEDEHQGADQLTPLPTPPQENGELDLGPPRSADPQ